MSIIWNIKNSVLGKTRKNIRGSPLKRGELFCFVLLDSQFFCRAAKNFSREAPNGKNGNVTLLKPMTCKYLINF